MAWKGSGDGDDNDNDDGDDGKKNNDKKGKARITRRWFVDRKATTAGRQRAIARILPLLTGLIGEDAPKPSTVLALPLSRQPLVPSMAGTTGIPLYSRDLPTLTELKNIAKSHMPYVGTFLYKDSDTPIDPSPLTDISLVHPIGTLAQVIYVEPVNIGGGGLGGVGSAGASSSSNSSSQGDSAAEPMEEEGTLFLRGHRECVY